MCVNISTAQKNYAHTDLINWLLTKK